LSPGEAADPEWGPGGTRTRGIMWFGPYRQRGGVSGEWGPRHQVRERKATDLIRLTRDVVGLEGRGGRAGKWKVSRTGPYTSGSKSARGAFTGGWGGGERTRRGEPEGVDPGDVSVAVREGAGDWFRTRRAGRGGSFRVID